MSSSIADTEIVTALDLPTMQSSAQFHRTTVMTGASLPSEPPLPPAPPVPPVPAVPPPVSPQPTPKPNMITAKTSAGTVNNLGFLMARRLSGGALSGNEKGAAQAFSL